MYNKKAIRSGGVSALSGEMGGAIALELVVALIHEREKRGLQRGFVTMCGGGQAIIMDRSE
jgi:acetyl-CoA acetyltransferase